MHPSNNYAVTDYAHLEPKYRKLLAEARKVTVNSYDPYRHYKVGAALLTDSGEIISAANVANSSYINSTCAERSAIAKANSQGERKFTAIAVIGRPSSGKSHIITPCGTCRQIIYEFASYSGRDMDVIMSNWSMKRIIVLKISKLLPLPHR